MSVDSGEQDKAIKLALERVLAEALELFSQHVSPDLLSKVQVVWNRRMRSAAGRAFWPDARVELNPRLIGISFDEVRRTLLHELAHLLAYARAGRRRILPHGPEWQLACADLGIAGEKVTHSLPLASTRQAKKWSYGCSHCGEVFLRVRRMQKVAACYHCCKIYNKGRFTSKFRLTERGL